MQDRQARKIIPPATRPRIFVGLMTPPGTVLACVALNGWLKPRLAEPVEILAYAPAIPIVAGAGLLVLLAICLRYRAHRGLGLIVAGALASGLLTAVLAFAGWMTVGFL